MHTMKCYSAIKSSELLIHATIQMQTIKKKAMQITCSNKRQISCSLERGLGGGVDRAQGNFGGNRYIHKLNCSGKFHEYILMSKLHTLSI